jgi:2-polyprenyl-6-methoxyphenol hydroxylase-like FAD-dependent oxidoreductase
LTNSNDVHMEKPRKRVAIVGSGLAGLVSANLLFNDARQRYAVRVFESVWTPELSIYPTVTLGREIPRPGALS